VGGCCCDLRVGEAAPNRGGCSDQGLLEMKVDGFGTCR
jgi:hypothetical protein